MFQLKVRSYGICPSPPGFSLSIMLSSSIHAVAKGISSFFLSAVCIGLFNRDQQCGLLFPHKRNFLFPQKKQHYSWVSSILECNMWGCFYSSYGKHVFKISFWMCSWSGLPRAIVTSFHTIMSLGITAETWKNIWWDPHQKDSQLASTTLMPMPLGSRRRLGLGQPWPFV